MTLLSIRTLVDRAYKVNDSLLSFNNDVKKAHTHLQKESVVKTYLDNNDNSAQSDNNNTLTVS